MLSDTPPTAPPREGSLDAPFRRPILWQDDDYYDLEKVHAETKPALPLVGAADACGPDGCAI